MSSDIMGKESRELRNMHLRSKMARLNDHLDNTEQSIMDMMRLKNCPPELSAEAIHCLIGERENTKHKLKDLHKKLYG